MRRKSSRKQGRSSKRRPSLGAGRSGGAAVDAAREWAYKTTTLNGIPTKVEIVSTFTFATMALNNRCINHVLFKDQIGRRMRA